MPRTLNALLAAAVGISLAGLATEPTATAVPAARGVAYRLSAGSVAVSHRATTTAGGGSPGDYWTPDRMRNATPAQAHRTAQQLRQAVSTPVAAKLPAMQVDPQRPMARQDLRTGSTTATRDGTIASRWQHPNALVAKTTGKVFFRSGGKDWVCSAGTIAGRRKNVIATAGHCVFGDKTQQWSRKFVFVPGYRDGEAPYGKYPARAFWTTRAYHDHQNLVYDVGFVRLGRRINGSRHVGAVVGQQGIWFDSPGTPWTHDFGYPSGAPQFHGKYLIYCAGDSTWYRHRKRRQYRLHCRMNGGASGGPWLRRFSHGSGYEFSVVSLVSYDSQHPKVNIGPYFGDVIRRVYRRAERR